MNFEDIGYLSLLIFSNFFGFYYKKIEDAGTKKLVGSIIGLFIILIVSGVHTIHCVIAVAVNALIIVNVNKRKCHIVSFGFTFLYLMFFRTAGYFGIPYAPAYTNMIQMVLTLKLVGLAFEVNSSHTLKSSGKESGDNKSDEQKLEDESNHLDVSYADVFNYSFNYITVLTGPYIRYRTFKDYFDLPLSKHADWKQTMIAKVRLIPLFIVLFLTASHFWPQSYAKTDEFYDERSFLYRLWYIWPNFFIFRTRLYVALIMSECSCVMAGLGAYPAFTEPKCGHGPSKNYGELQSLMKDADKLKSAEYNFETIHNVNPKQAEFCPSIRQTMYQWNMCIQYWLAVMIYKRFPSKKYRTFATVLVSAVWHGIYTGYYVTLCGTPLCFPIDDVYVKLVLKDRSGLLLKIAECFMVIFKMFFFSYLAMAFQLLSMDWVMHYYNSVYHAGIFIGIGAYLLGIQLLKLRRKQAPTDDGDERKIESTKVKSK